MKKMFKTDGIRGKYEEDITLNLAFKVGYNLHCLNNDKVIIGYDTRYSGIDLANQLKLGCKMSGINCLLLGVCSTPKLAYYSKKFNCIGVMITASHNPYYDNGIKIFNKGFKLSNLEEELLEEKLKESISYEDTLKTMLVETKDKVGIDCAHGGASLICKEIFKTKNYHIINSDYNGYDINSKCGALYPEKIRDYVLKNNLDYGFCFDGDADRIIMCDNQGHIFDGDYLAYLIANYYKLSSVVLTKMSNLGIIEAFEKKNIKVYLCDSGDKNVHDLMVKNNILLGAEASGHIINLDWSSTGDGVLNAVNLINILSENKDILSNYYNEIKIYPAELRNYKVDINEEQIKDLYDLINDKYPNIVPYIRISGTEKVLRVYLQCKDKDILDLGFIVIEDEICKL